MIYFMKPARRGSSDATRRRIVGTYLAERARRRYEIKLKRTIAPCACPTCAEVRREQLALCMI